MIKNPPKRLTASNYLDKLDGEGRLADSPAPDNDQLVGGGHRTAAIVSVHCR